MIDTFEDYLVEEEITLVQAMQKIDNGAMGIVFVIDKNKSLIGCVSDGDIRRWLIKTADLSASVRQFMFKEPKYIFMSDKKNADAYMEKFLLNALPIVDIDMKVQDIIFRKRISTQDDKSDKSILRNVSVVIMAGGKGTRLYPYTKILPKPLIPIGDIPIIERIINNFVKDGVMQFYLTVNYKKGMIKSYFEDLNPKYKVNYIEEDKPLGTGGSLKLIKKKFERPIIVTNSDVLIQANIEDIYNQHINSGNEITIVSSLKNIIIPYGVLKVKENGIIEEMQEKPSISYFINTGMYVINPELIELIPNDTFFHMPQLLEKCIKRNMRVGIYPVSEDSFLDMGEFEEMKRMERELEL